MGKFFEVYQKLDKALRKECDEMVERGEMSEDEAEFRYYMVRDEILEDMPDIPEDEE